MAGCLDGIRVLELARFQAGPRRRMLLSDLGAEVIKALVEWCRQRTVAEICEKVGAIGVPVAPVLSIPQVAASKHLWA